MNTLLTVFILATLAHRFERFLRFIYLFIYSIAGFTQYPFVIGVVGFCKFFLLHEKACSFSSAVVYVQIRTNRTVKYQAKVFWQPFCEEMELDFKISLLSLMHKSSEENFLSMCDSLVSGDMDK